MSASNPIHDATQDAREQVSQLRDQVQTLMNDRVNPALASAADKAQQYADQAQKYAGQARDVYDEQTEALSERVRESPLVAVLIAAGVGYLVGRLVR